MTLSEFERWVREPHNACPPDSPCNTCITALDLIADWRRMRSTLEQICDNFYRSAYAISADTLNDLKLKP